MSREIIVKKRDDLDSTLNADETLSFTFDNTVYTLDLCTANAERLREFLAPYMKQAFQKEKAQKATKPPKVEDEAQKREREAIRQWGHENGIAIGQRISADVLAAYRASTTEVDIQPRKESVRDRGKAARSLAVPDKKVREQMRAWALANGYDIGNRGYIRGEIQEAYNEANGVAV